MFQNRGTTTVSAPYYIRNGDVHCEVQVRTVKDTQNIARVHEARFYEHPNLAVLQFLDNQDLVRQRKRAKSFEVA